MFNNKRDDIFSKRCHLFCQMTGKLFILSCSMKPLLFLSLLLFCYHQNSAQPFSRDVLKENRDKLYRNIVNNTINHNLSAVLTDSTEDRWQDAFAAIELIHYRSPWIDNKIYSAFNDIQKRSIPFQRSLLELGYADYPGIFYIQVRSLLLQTDDAKIFAMCVTYILKTEQATTEINFLREQTTRKLSADKGNAILEQLLYQINNNGKEIITPSIHTFLQKKYLSGHVLLISFQRRNRDFPGLIMVRDENGNFIKNEYGEFFAVPQLARSVASLPGYLTNGNTPEGIFRMYGTENSKSIFIGPTSNIQLTVPFEKKPSHFFNNPDLSDTDWNIDRYKRLLPENFKDYYPAYQSYYAGKAGRTEIIAHGTTVDPGYSKGKPYYPLSPTQGCLCTKEIWSETTGMLLESGQQQLSDAISKAGGAFGYAIVINLDDKQEPVTINDIIPFLKLANQN